MENIPPMYLIQSNRDPLSIEFYELNPISISEAKKWVSDEKGVIDWNNPIKGTRYYFKETTREIIIYDDEPTYAEEHGYDTGLGDLWGYSIFASFDKNVIFELYKKELKRITDKYFLKD